MGSELRKIAVIGGGASGLIAALFASEKNSVTLFEKQKKIGRKILVSGNGRCNITNRKISKEKYHGGDIRFIEEVLNKFGLKETVSFFESIGLPLVEEKNGKLYPASLQSSTVVKIFAYELSRRNVAVELHRKIESIVKTENGFKLETAGKEIYEFDAVVLAAGSNAYTAAGASMSGYELAASLGHKIIDTFPAILPVNISNKNLHKLEGIKWDCGCRVLLDGVVLASSTGEVLFTSYGLSGPAALDISRELNSILLQCKTPAVEIDFFPYDSVDSLNSRLEIVLSDKGKKTSFSLLSVLKERMPDIILDAVKISPEKRNGELSKTERENLASSLKSFKLAPGKPRDFTDAVVAAGGVSTDEINSETMESKLVKNLYITGELLDIDGDSGGFNLQFAWSSGAIAGKALSSI